jgi:hypothetical protein
LVLPEPFRFGRRSSCLENALSHLGPAPCASLGLARAAAGGRFPAGFPSRRADRTEGGVANRFMRSQQDSEFTEEVLMPLIQVNVIGGVFTEAQKREIVRKLTDAMDLEGPDVNGAAHDAGEASLVGGGCVGVVPGVDGWAARQEGSR